MIQIVCICHAKGLVRGICNGLPGKKDKKNDVISDFYKFKFNFNIKHVQVVLTNISV